jgi:uncharacterized protein (TIGR00730 family)
MRICVFCGSSSGHNKLYPEAARETGRTLARMGIDLVYGGGRVGLMGVLAAAVLMTGGRVIGVIPQSLLEREIQHTGLSELHIVATIMSVRRKWPSWRMDLLPCPAALARWKRFSSSGPGPNSAFTISHAVS